MRARLSLTVFFLTFEALAMSGIDAKFRVNRADYSSFSSVEDRSESVNFYKQVLSQTLSTSCDFYPNDSRKAQLDFRRCSPLYSIFSAMERFYKEPDVSKLGFEVVQIKNKNYFFDLPYNCDFFN